MEKTFDELLSEDTGPVEAVETVETTPRDEAGRFVASETGDNPQPEPEAPAMEAEQVPPTSDKLPPDTFKGLKEEREKRQALERELQALRDQFQAQQAPADPPPSLWEDEQAWEQDLTGKVVTTAVQQATLNAKLDMSEMMVRQSNPDFEEVKAEFLELAQVNPALVQQALADPHPWNKAYHIAKNARTMRDLGATDLVQLEAKMREKIMAELQAQPARQSLPPTLSNERNLGARGGPAWSGPKSLDELLG
jgi:hypothetical protein